tara:strand:+ start:2116 stop:2568 length:453 start_codon:yes stop_codon:yes gene_type:complete
MKFEKEKLNELLEACAEANKTNVKSMIGKGRRRFNVEARQMAYSILRNSGWYFTEIGEAFDRNHASIINGCSSHRQDYATFNYYAEAYDDIRIKMSIHTNERTIVKREVEQKIIDEVERLRNENARLKDNICKIQTNANLLTKSLKVLCV